MNTKQNYVFAFEGLAEKWLSKRSKDFSAGVNAAMTEMIGSLFVNPETFSSFRIEVNADGDMVNIGIPDGFHPVVEGVRQDQIILVSFLKVIPSNKRHIKHSRMFSEENPQGFLLTEAEAAVKCFVGRCQAEDPKQKVVSDNDILPLKG